MWLKTKSRIPSSRSSLPDQQGNEEGTHSLVVGELQPGLILHGALAQVNGWRWREGGAEERDVEKSADVSLVVWLCRIKITL